MNKRIKLKHGTLRKKCNEECEIYKFIERNLLITNNVCGGCKYREEAYKLCIENENKLEATNGIHVYKMDEYDWVASKWSIEKTKEWYDKEYGFNEDEIAIEEIYECDLDKNGAWYETPEEKDIKELGESDELIIGSSKNPRSGSLKKIGGYVFKYKTFREILLEDSEFEEPFTIATTEW